MLLTPQQILQHMGFDVPEEGIKINPDDAYLLTTALRLAGETIDIDRVQNTKLIELHCGLAGIVSSWSDADQIQPIRVDRDPSEASLEKLRSTLQVLLKVTFKRIGNQ